MVLVIKVLLRVKDMATIEEITIKEFRGINATKEPIKLSKFNVLIGKNNSGKSSIPESMYLFPLPFRAYPIPLLGKSKLEFISRLHSDSSALIYGYSGRSEITLKVKNNRITYRLQPSGEVKTLIDGTELSTRKYIDEIIDILEINKGDPISELNTYTLFIPNDTSFIKELSDSIKRDWNLVMKSGANVRIVKELISKVVHDTYTEVFLGIGNTLMLRKELPNDRIFWIKVPDIGDGVEKVLISTLSIEITEPKIILWDDIEASVHPGLIEILINWLSKRDSQIILSTHSIDVLDAISKVEPRDAAILVTKMDKNDYLEVKKLNLDELSDAIESNVDIRKICDLI